MKLFNFPLIFPPSERKNILQAFGSKIAKFNEKCPLKKFSHEEAKKLSWEKSFYTAQ